MELIYNVNRRNSTKRDVQKEDDILCRLSLKNIITFTSGCCLSASESENTNTGSYYVYVCDIDKPWEVYLVSSFLHKVVSLEWHNSGFKLLIGTEDGSVRIYQMKDYCLNDWKLTHKAEVHGEHFCNIQWLNHGFKVTLNGDKRDISSYSDKLIRDNLPPSLSYYGGKAAEGWIGVTATGLVCVGLPSSKDDSCPVRTECLGVSRQRLLIADMLHEKNGDVVVLASSGQASAAVSSHQVSLRQQRGGECEVGLQHLSSLYTRGRGTDGHQITMLRLLNRDDLLSAVICMGSAAASQVELWSLNKQPLTLKRAFQSTPHDTKLYSYHWTHQASVTHPSLPVSLASPYFPLRYHALLDNSAKAFQYLAVAYRDGSIKIISKHTFQPIATTNLDMGFTDMDQPDKKKRVVPYILTMQQTLTGCGLVGIDQLGCLYMMKVVNTRDTLTHVHPHYMVSVLEYLTFTGADCWDVLISIKPGLLESIIQRLSDNFLKQPAGMQEVLFERHMAIKGSLFRCSAGGQQRAADAHCRLMLHTISTHFRAQLRPKGLSAQDMGPVEKLISNCNKNTELDIDKVMMTLNPEKKEFMVLELTLQASQPLIQWVADLVLYLLTALPMCQGYGSTFPGASLLRDASCLASLRELMVVIRIWGLINMRCLPHFTTTTANLDTINEMFKILTRVWMAARDSKGLDFEEGLVDKCCLLRSQIYPAHSEQGLFGSSSGYSILSQNHPVKYTFEERPAGGEARQTHSTDMVHQVSLGINSPQPTKTCSRCANTCLALSTCKYPVLQAWEGKWLKECLCGGHWTISK